MNRFAPILLALFSIAAAAAAELTPEGQQAFSSLKTASMFRFGNGRASGASPSERCISLLLKEKESKEAFQQLITEASLPGQLYALTVQKSFDPKAFGRNISFYLTMTNQVEVLEGCLVLSKPVSQIAMEIRRGRYDGGWPHS